MSQVLPYSEISPRIDGHSYQVPATPADAGSGWMRLRPGQIAHVAGGQSIIVRMDATSPDPSPDVYVFEEDGQLTGPLLYQRSARHLTSDERTALRKARLKRAGGAAGCALLVLAALLV